MTAPFSISQYQIIDLTLQHVAYHVIGVMNEATFELLLCVGMREGGGEVGRGGEGGEGLLCCCIVY